MFEITGEWMGFPALLHRYGAARRRRATGSATHIVPYGTVSGGRRATVFLSLQTSAEFERFCDDGSSEFSLKRCEIFARPAAGRPPAHDAGFEGIVSTLRAAGIETAQRRGSQNAKLNSRQEFGTTAARARDRLARGRFPAGPLGRQSSRP